MLEIINQAAKSKSPEKDLSNLLSTLLVGIDDLAEDERKLTEEYLTRVLFHKLFRAVRVGDQQAAVQVAGTNQMRQEILEGWDIFSSWFTGCTSEKYVDEMIKDGETCVVFINGWPKLMEVTA